MSWNHCPEWRWLGQRAECFIAFAMWIQTTAENIWQLNEATEDSQPSWVYQGPCLWRRLCRISTVGTSDVLAPASRTHGVEWEAAPLLGEHRSCGFLTFFLLLEHEILKTPTHWRADSELGNSPHNSAGTWNTSMFSNQQNLKAGGVGASMKQVAGSWP